MHPVKSTEPILLSFIVAAYNVERYINKCVSEILVATEQTKEKTELVIIDDGSTDGTAGILDKYADAYPGFINVHSQENAGQSVARNVGMRHARGEYIWFVDADDFINSQSFSEVLEIIDRGDCDYYLFESNRIDKDGNITGRFRLGCEPAIYGKINFTYEFVQTCVPLHMPWQRIYRKSFVDKIEFPPGITHEDIHYDLRILSREPVMSMHTLIIYNHYFTNPDSTTNTMTMQKQKQVLWVYADLIDGNASSEFDERIQPEIEKVCVHEMLTRLMYILSLEYMHHQKRNLYAIYRKRIVDHYSVFSAKDVRLRMSLWEKIFRTSVYINSYWISLVTVRLRSML